MRWLNPLVWFSASWEYVRQHFVAWQLSEFLTWLQAIVVTILYPSWAQDLVAHIPIVWEQVCTTCRVLAEVCVELFQNTS